MRRTKESGRRTELQRRRKAGAIRLFPAKPQYVMDPKMPGVNVLDPNMPGVNVLDRA